MIKDILILVLLNYIHAPNWCFILCWCGFALDALLLFINVYRTGKKHGKEEQL